MEDGPPRKKRARGAINAQSILFDQFLEPALALEIPSLDSLKKSLEREGPIDSKEAANILHDHLVETRLPIRNKILSRVERFDISFLLDEKETKGAAQRARASADQDHRQVVELGRQEVMQRLEMMDRELEQDCLDLEERIRKMQARLLKRTEALVSTGS